jgi:hypothetical protein
MSGKRSASMRAGAKTTPGYSGKPLWQKLGLAPGLRVWLRHAPAQYWKWCGFDAADVKLAGTSARNFDFGHVFVTSRAQLAAEIPIAARLLDAGGMLWISWPKKSSGVTSDLGEDTLRELALPLGLVDVKVCAVTEVWSGLKFCWRRTAKDSAAPASSNRKPGKSA